MRLTPVNTTVTAWIVALFCVAVVWSGRFDLVKYFTSVLVLIMVIGVFYVAWVVAPDFREVLIGLFGFQLPEIPEWALKDGSGGIDQCLGRDPSRAGLGRGWVRQSGLVFLLGAGKRLRYGGEGGFGLRANENKLASMTRETALRVKGWCRMVYADATTALFLGILVTACFLLAGVGVLGKLHIAPTGAQVAIQLSEIFGSFWGRTGAVLFLLAGMAAMVSTNLCQYAGWPRIMSDCVRITLRAL